MSKDGFKVDDLMKLGLSSYPGKLSFTIKVLTEMEMNMSIVT